MRDHALEQCLRDDLDGQEGLTETAMFGGLAFLLLGNLLACARHDGLLVRLGRGNDSWALALPGAAPLQSGSRPMRGWVRVPAAFAADPALRRRLLDAALAFAAALPPK